MHLRTRPRPFYCSLRGQRKTGSHLKPLSVPPGKNISWQEQMSGLYFRSWVHHHYSFPVSRTSTSISWRLQKDHNETRTVSLKTQAGPLPLCWLHRAAQRASGQHILISNCTFTSDVTTPQCSNTAHSSVVINHISHVNQSRVVSVFWWLLFSFWMQEIKILILIN